jgi:hypothetical protein
MAQIHVFMHGEALWCLRIKVMDIIKRLHISDVVKSMQKVWDVANTNMSVPLSSITIRTPPPGALIASVLTYPPFGVCCKAVSRRWLQARRRLSASTAAYSGEHDVIWSFWPLWFASPFAACPNNRKTSATSHGLHPQKSWANQYFRQWHSQKVGKFQQLHCRDISTLKTLGIILWVHTIYKPTIFEREVHIAVYKISIGLKVVCIWQNSNLEEGGGCIMDVWQVYLGLHTIFLHEGLYCVPHYTSAHPL